MNNLSLFLFLTIISFNQINAQESRKSFLGVNFSFILIEQTVNIDESYLLISPEVGKMLNDKVALGVGFGFVYSIYNQKAFSLKIKNIEAIEIAPFIRIHNTITENFKYFIEPNCRKIFIVKDSSNKSQIYSAGINIGLLYFISQKISMELYVCGINYNYMSYKDFGSTINNISIVNHLVIPNIGLKYNIR